MKRLVEERNRLEAEMRAIQNKIAGLDLAIKILQGDTSASSPAESRPAKRGNVKETVIELVTESGASGLSAVECVESAKDKLLAGGR
jgi:hypothetical protein